MSMFSSDKQYEVIPEGRHTGLLYALIDLGTHEDTFQGVTKFKHELYVGFELPEVLMSDGRPFMWGKTFNVTNGRFGPYISKTSNLYKFLKVWTGQDDPKLQMLGKLIGHPATISIVHEEGKKDATKIYAVAETVKPFKGKAVPAAKNEPIIYELGEPGSEIPANVFEWCKKKMVACKEWNGGVPKPEENGSGMIESDMHDIDSDIPF